MVEDLLAARGITVSHQTVKLWAEKFGRHFANDIRMRSAGKLGDKWHLDEAVITTRRGERNTAFGVRSIMTVSFSTFWWNAAAMPRLPGV